MIKELKYITLEYTEDDLEYLDYITEKIETISEEIVNFFEGLELNEKVKVILFNDLDKFKKACLKYKRDKKMPDWVTGLTHCDGVYTLSLKELRKTKSPGNKTVDDLAHLILHEFTHACTNQYVDYNKKCMWLSEGIACNLSHQYDSSKYNFKATEDEVLNGPTGYDNYSIMFKYALDKYGRDYILNLIKNPDLFEEETHRIFTEVTKQKKHL